MTNKQQKKTTTNERKGVFVVNSYRTVNLTNHIKTFLYTLILPWLRLLFIINKSAK